ncbi:MAG: hypothetical protein ACLTWK_00190 [Eisenbergiella sp.]
MAKGKFTAIRIAKQLPYITEKDIEYMSRSDVSEDDCYRRMKQRRISWEEE